MYWKWVLCNIWSRNFELSLCIIFTNFIMSIVSSPHFSQYAVFILHLYPPSLLPKNMINTKVMAVFKKEKKESFSEHLKYPEMIQWKPGGSQLTHPEKDSNAHTLWFQKHGSPRKPDRLFTSLQPLPTEQLMLKWLGCHLATCYPVLLLHWCCGDIVMLKHGEGLSQTVAMKFIVYNIKTI